MTFLPCSTSRSMSSKYPPAMNALPNVVTRRIASSVLGTSRAKMSRSAAGTAFLDRNMRGGSGDMALPRGIEPLFSP